VYQQPPVRMPQTGLPVASIARGDEHLHQPAA
jgi:hypothetical protein